jgi:predicted dienelactone hydrolase
MQPRLLKIISFTILALVGVMALLIIPQLELPAPTGPYAVGERIFRWVDPARPEVLTEAPEDFREVVALVWYPAEPRTGTNAGYFPGLSTVSKALSESGEVGTLEVFGLQFIRSRILMDADLATSQTPHPVLILSPGNGTNIEFYASLASEIASQGYIVVGG